jgi:hypothetical protein
MPYKLKTIYILHHKMHYFPLEKPVEKFSFILQFEVASVSLLEVCEISTCTGWITAFIT